jgi:hypothetical protein
MIHYHGMPITPDSAAAVAVEQGHAFISYRHTDQLRIAIQVAQSFAVDNGAFSAWRSGHPVTDWSAFYEWAGQCKRIPSCDFAVIPDVIDGTEKDNDALLSEWPLPKWFGAPVWHMHESLDRLARLAADYPRVCLGSSGQYATPATKEWWARMVAALRVVCDCDGAPMVKLHGLRMLNSRIVEKLPLASADSTNLGRNIGIDKRWSGAYAPPNKNVRAAILRSRIEAVNAPAVFDFNEYEKEQAC